MNRLILYGYAFWRWKFAILFPTVTAFWIASDVLRTRRYKQQKALEEQQQQE